MKTEFEKGEKAKIVVLSELQEQADAWGKRHLNQARVSYNNTWNVAWYEPGAWSSPHHHERSESVYYFGFKGEGGKCKTYLGWPLSEAKVTVITETTLIYIPAYEVHCFSNIGDVEMFLLHAFSPPWEEDLGVTIDLVDAESGRTYSDMKEYADHVREGDERFKTLEGYIEHLKEIGKY